MSKILVVDNLIKKYRSYVAVDDISFKVNKGQIYAFLGPNGAGKSTTMKILATMLYPTSGKVTFNNQSFFINQQKIKMRIGVVFQDNTLDEQLSVYYNLYSRALLYKLSHQEIKKRIAELAEEMNLSAILYKKYQHCSGGQKRLVMIARALIHQPDLIILDEPTTALDPHIRNLVWEKLLKFKREKNLTIFFSSHYMEEATKYADFICMLNKGKVIMADTPAALLQHYGDKRLYIKEEKKEYQIQVKDAREALVMLHRLGRHLNSFELKNPSLEEIFLNETQVEVTL